MNQLDRSVTELRQARRRRPLPAAAWLVASVATLAGVGVVSLPPPSPQALPAAMRNARQVRSICTRVVEVTFNPRVARGLKIAKVAFRFTYRIDPADRERVKLRIDSEWDRLVSRCLEVLIQHSPRELKDSAGLESVAHQLRTAIDHVLFDDGSGWAEEILWQQIVVQ